MLAGARTSGAGGSNLFDSMTAAQWTLYSNAAQEFDRQAGRSGFFTDELGQLLLDTYDTVHGGDRFLFPFALTDAADESSSSSWPADPDEFVEVFEGYLRGARRFGARYYGGEAQSHFERSLDQVIETNFAGNSEDADEARDSMALELQARLLRDHMKTGLGNGAGRMIAALLGSDNVDVREFGRLLLMDVPWAIDPLSWRAVIQETAARTLRVEESAGRSTQYFSDLLKPLIKPAVSMNGTLISFPPHVSELNSLHTLLERGQSDLARIFYNFGKETSRGWLLDFGIPLMHIAASQEAFTPQRLSVISGILKLINFIDMIPYGSMLTPVDLEFMDLIVYAMAYLAQSRPDADADARVVSLLNKLSHQIESSRSFSDRFRSEEGAFEHMLSRLSGLIESSSSELADIIKRAPSAPPAPVATPPSEGSAVQIARHVESDSGHNVRRLVDSLDRSWTKLTLEEQAEAMAWVHYALSHFCETLDDKLAVLNFFAAHESDIPRHIINDLKENGDLVRVFAHRPPEDDAVQRPLKFFIRIADERALHAIEMLAGNGIETRIGNEFRNQGGGLWSGSNGVYLLSQLFVLGLLSPPERKQALEMLMDLYDYVDSATEIRIETEDVLKIMLSYATQEERKFVLEYLKGKFEQGAGGGDSGIDVERIVELAKNIPSRHFPILFETLAFFFSRRNPEVRPLIRHLLNKTDSPGEFQQVVPFLRDFNAVSMEMQTAFFNYLVEDSRRTIEGQKGRQVDATQIAIRLDPPRAQSRFRNFLIEQFSRTIVGTRTERAAVREDIRRRMELWQEGNLLLYLASLASFSNSAGIEAIGRLVQALMSEVSRQATQAARESRFLNPDRYWSMAGAFSPEFIQRWSNNDGDRVVQLGNLDAGEYLSRDPLIIRKRNYEHTARQMAVHLGIEGAAHLDGDALFADLIDHIRDLQIGHIENGREWLSLMASLVMKMRQTAEISEGEAEEAVRFVRTNDGALGREMGPNAREIISDLTEFKRNLTARALTGRAWLIITSNPADLIGSGKSPVTCQDPTRRTGFNCRGQPVNRALEGRFLYAKVVIASDVHIENGVAVTSADAIDAARIHLEATTSTGLPDPAARPHLLVERLYAHPGFIYSDLLAKALNTFAGQDLGLDPGREVHIQFTGQNMDSYPQALYSEQSIYRDTFFSRETDMSGDSGGAPPRGSPPPAPAAPYAPPAPVTPVPLSSAAASASTYEEITRAPDQDWQGEEWDAASEGDYVEYDPEEDPSLADFSAGIYTGTYSPMDVAVP